MKTKTFYHPQFDCRFDLTNNRIYFWRGMFSQWFRSDIDDPETGVTFNTAEQAMMYYKAYIFGDKDIAQQILNSHVPAVQKALGRKVRGYDDAVWAEKRLEIVSSINYLKFKQNNTHAFLALNGYEFVEASPVDCIWGVGLAEDDSTIYDPTKWRGLNLLGKALNNAHKRLVEEL